MSITVEVTVKGALADRLPEGTAHAEVTEGTPVRDVLKALALPVLPCVFVVNGVASAGGRILADGDRVQLHPQQAGG